MAIKTFYSVLEDLKHDGKKTFQIRRHESVNNSAYSTEWVGNALTLAEAKTKVAKLAALKVVYQTVPK